MKSKIHYNNKEYLINLNEGIEISIPYTQRIEQTNCFFAPYFSYEPVRMGDFVGSIQEGGPVNFTNVKLNVHGNGTHTECCGHVTKEFISVNKILHKYFFTVTLLSIYPTKLENGDLRIEKETLSSLMEEISTEALCIRCLPNDDSKKSRKYSGTNPTYFSKEAMKYIVDLGIEHLLVDIPSVDREEDGGKLEAHRTFWSRGRGENCTITELIFIPNEIIDGEYILNLQLADMELDAVPSRPILYKILDEHI